MAVKQKLSFPRTLRIQSRKLAERKKKKRSRLVVALDSRFRGNDKTRRSAIILSTISAILIVVSFMVFRRQFKLKEKIRILEKELKEMDRRSIS